MEHFLLSLLRLTTRFIYHRTVPQVREMALAWHEQSCLPTTMIWRWRPRTMTTSPHRLLAARELPRGRSALEPSTYGLTSTPKPLTDCSLTVTRVKRSRAMDPFESEKIHTGTTGLVDNWRSKLAASPSAISQIAPERSLTLSSSSLVMQTPTSSSVR